MQPKINLLSTSILAAGILFSPLVFAQENPGNADPAATPSPSVEQSTSTSESVKESIGNAASDVEEGAKNAYHKASSEITSTKITAKAKAALLTDDNTKHSTINVKTKRGVVTLSGKVDSEATAQHAQEVVSQIEGVKEVRNRLKY
jgi:hyperosmotically inducible protein